jgi:hypothetical protein
MVVKARLKDEVLKIYLPLREPRISKSGKTMVIATTMGPAGTGIEYNGQQILVVANAIIRNSEQKGGKTQEPRKKTSGVKAPATK